MAIGLDGSVHAEADAVFQRWRAKYSKAMRNAGAPPSSSTAYEVNTAIGLAFVRRCTRAMRAWSERLAAELVRGRRPKVNRDSNMGGTEHRQKAEVTVVKRPRPKTLVAARGEIPEAIRRTSEKLQNRYDLSNVPLVGGGNAMAGSVTDASQLVCPLGPNLRASDAPVGGSIPSLSQQTFR